MAANNVVTLADFAAGRINPAFFHHREHVQVSYELLERHPFPEALLHLAHGLRALAASAGKPEAYHQTFTTAFLAVIAERRLRGAYHNSEDFVTRNPDLLRKEILTELYDPIRLSSSQARQTFLLPRPLPA